jgi:O-antigen/teichoic acid export membrane protein
MTESMPNARLTPQPVAAPAPAASGSMHEVHRRFSRNVAATIFARVVNMARGVLVVPFLLRHLGLEAYGIWTTIFILVSYVGLTTLGLSNVYIKYIAEFHARKEYDRANSLLSTGLCITVPLCAALFAGFFFGWEWYAPWLHLPPQHAADGKEAVLIVLGIFLSSIALSAFGDILAGVQEIASTQMFLAFSILVEFGLILWFVGSGRGIRGLAEAYLVRILINDGLTIWWSWRKLKWMRISPRLVRREAIGHVIHFGGVVQVQTILDIVLASVEKLLGLCLIGAAAAGLMDVARKWQIAYSSVPMAFFGALLPAVSHVDAASHASQRMDNLRVLYLNSARFSNLCTAAFVALTVFWSHAILLVWLGPELPMRQTLTTLFVVFSLALQFHMLTGPGTSLLRGMGRVYEEFTYTIPNILLLGVTLPVAWWIQKSWTALGIGVAVSVATAIAACGLLARVHHLLGLPMRRFFSLVIAPGLVPFLTAALLAWPVAWAAHVLGRWQGAAVLLAAGLVYLAATSALLYRWVFSTSERVQARAMLLKVTALLSNREVAA